ncbi:glutamine synthetase [Thermosporothrix hazakensis]|jgi:glutamine synthetase|uniref:Glutamine synthetase n=2 Tax=Thermosporothrix TaxID=768650 RepID=A0A326U7C6_THEHA|nr:glutamine synthetase family protein [Thermosporothrix hazakensis]PZW26653.1 glutamine synthetase [Thermosporothrix hazakensis]BBH89461.1 glutamine synthetase [Thermosporothrix sp. COM3]GCE47645.1 glutamine synthetase [Thermosporothrix hazakensis]
MAGEQGLSMYEKVMATIEHERVRFVNLEFTDIVGMAKCVTIPVEQFVNSVRYGKWFDGSSLEAFARVAESDMYLFPDLSTFAVLPDKVRPVPTIEATPDEELSASDVVARVICEVRTPEGERFDGDSRATLMQALQLAQEMGFFYRVSPELEFFLLRFEGKTPTPLPHDRGSYFDLSTDLATVVRRQMVRALQKMGFTIEASHHEVAEGQHELDFEIADALHIADGLMTAKYVLKAIASQYNLYATFLPKPFFGINGSGLHTHQQLISKETGKNAFVDMQAEYGLSQIGRYFIAGQLAHAPAMCAILAPLVNSYKRLVRGYEAPVLINWGRINRQALIRVPHLSKDPETSMRIELRCADPSCNPYLAFAVMLRAGLDGIQRKLDLPGPMEENLFLQDEGGRLRPRARLLPATLGEALDALRSDSLIRETLGDSIYEGFIDAKSIEWTEYREQVHGWEIDRYLPIF